jgi:ParB family chromosome partitioning protein
VVSHKMAEAAMKLEYIDIDQIRPNPFQPREHFEKESLQELTNSIKNGGVVQPIVVRKHGANYEIIAGERRWRATRMAGVKKIPAIVKDIAEDRILIESLVENLHRLDLSDPERENAVHELWEKRNALGIKTKSDLAKAIGMREATIAEDLDAWEFRRKENTAMAVSTRTIRGTRGLEPEERKQIVEKVKAEEFKVSEVDTVAKVVRKAPETVKRELLKPKSRITPKMAETIVEKLPTKEDQEEVLKEAIQLRLTEDELTARVQDIKRSRAEGKAPFVDRQIIVHGQWLMDRIRSPVNDIMSINPDAFTELDNRQRKEVLAMLTKLHNRIGDWIRRLGGTKVVDVE